MASIVFVHGTSVRYEGYAKTFTTLNDRLLARRPDVRVVPCAWGDLLGSPTLDDLALIPQRRRQKPAEPGKARARTAERVQARRSVIDLAPLDELRQLALLWSERSESARSLFGMTAASHLRDGVRAASVDPELLGALKAAGVAAVFTKVLTDVAGSDLVKDCVGAIRNVNGPDWALFADCFTEAVIAETFRVADPPSPQRFSAEYREALAARLLDLLRGRQLGLPGPAEKALRLAVAASGKVVEHWRGPFSVSMQPFVGDIFRYLAFGERLRQFIAGTVARARSPVVLLGHSLGGIACLDLLARNPDLGVTQLVTVGSQASQLYLMQALPGLPDDAAIPDGFPPWINVYSPHDLLSYLAAPVFGADKVSDIEISGARTMPAAHSAYFEQDAFYDVLAGVDNTEIPAAR